MIDVLASIVEACERSDDPAFDADSGSTSRRALDDAVNALKQAGLFRLTDAEGCAVWSRSGETKCQPCLDLLKTVNGTLSQAVTPASLGIRRVFMRDPRNPGDGLVHVFSFSPGITQGPWSHPFCRRR